MSDEVEGLAVKLAFKDAGVGKEITNLKGQIKSAASAFEAAGAGIKDFGQTIDGLKSKQEYLNSALKSQKEIITLYQQELTKAETRLKKQVQAQQELTVQVKAAKEAYTSAKQSKETDAETTEKLKKAYEALEDKLTRTNKSITTASNSINNWTTKHNKANAELKEMQSTLNATEKDLADYGQTAEKSSTQLEKFSQNAQKTSEHLSKAGSAMSSAGGKMTTTLTAPIVAAGAAALATATNFEEAMTRVKVKSQANDADYEKLVAKAKEVGATTKFSAAECAQAFEYMAMAGWKTDQMIAAIDGTMSLSAATGEQLSTVTDIVTDAMTAFGMSAEEASHFADVLTASALNSNTSVAQMGESFTYCAPIAGAFKFSVEDTALMLGLMANNSIKASQSGTALRRIFTQLSSDIEVLQADGSKLVVSTQNADGSMRSLKDIVNDLRSAFNGMGSEAITSMQGDLVTSAKQLGIALEDDGGKLKTQAELYAEVQAACESMASAQEGLSDASKVQEAESIASKTAMAGLLSIINTTSGDYDKLSEAIYNCKGISQEMSEEMLDNAAGDLTLFKSELEGLLIQIGEDLVPILREALGVMREWIEKFESLDEGTQKAILKSAAVVAALGPALKVTGSIVSGLSSVVGLTAKVSTAIAGAGGLGAALGTAATAAGPWIAALAVIGAGLYSWYYNAKKTKEIQDALNESMSKGRALDIKGADAGSMQEVEQIKIDLAGYDDTKAKLEEIKKLREEAVNELNTITYDASSIEQFDGDYSKLNARVKELQGSIKNLGKTEQELFAQEQQSADSIRTTYGSYEQAQILCGKYDDAIARANEDKQLEAKLTDASTIALNNEANQYLDTANNIAYLTKEYEALSSKEKQSKEDKERLKQIESELSGIMGQSCTIINAETGLIEINKSLVNQEEAAQRSLGQAKKDLVKTWAEGGLDRVKAQRDESVAILSMYQKEQETLKAMGAPSSVIDWSRSKIAKEENKINEFDTLLNNYKQSNATVTASQAPTITYKAPSTADTTKSTTSKTTATKSDPLKEALDNFELMQQTEKLAMDEEMQRLETIKNKYAKTAAERAEMDTYIFKNFKDLIERKKNLNQLDYNQEVKMYEEGIASYAATNQQKAELSSTLLDIKAKHSLAWIEQEKFYNRLSLEEEKAAYERIKAYSKDNAEYQKDMAKKIYTTEQEIKKQQQAALEKQIEANISAYEKEYNARVELIDKTANAQIEAYNAQIEALEKTKEAEDDYTKEKNFKNKLTDLRDQMNSTRTQEEFLKLKEEYDSTNASLESFYRDKELADKKAAIQEKIDTITAEANKQKEVEKEKYEAYKAAQENIKSLAQTSEQDITSIMGQELEKRKALLNTALMGMLALVQGMAPNFKTATAGLFTNLLNVNAMQAANALKAANTTTNNNTSVTNNSKSNTSNININQTYNAQQSTTNATTSLISALQALNRAKGRN